MTICPECGQENMPGADSCEACQSSLTRVSSRPPIQPEEERILRDAIRELHPREVLTVSPETSVRDVMQLMVDKYEGCVVVVENDRPVGIFSERDALMRIGPDAAELGDRPVSEFMTSTPTTLEANDKIAFALQKMAGGGYR
ncbi:MAG: CBS domain-containing protein, partial [Pirellulales bacterium]